MTARGQFGSFPNPQAAYLSPQALAQAQAQVMAQAQAFAAMQGQWNQGGPNGFNGFQPNFGAYPQPPQHRSHQQRKPYAKKEPYVAPVPIPTKPVSEQICKHGIKCTKPTCPFSHPSPVATESSGIVLSSEACDAQLSCVDMVSLALHFRDAALTIPFCRIARNLTSLSRKRMLLRRQRRPLRLPFDRRRSLIRIRFPALENDLVNSLERARELAVCLFIRGMREVGIMLLFPVIGRRIVHEVCLFFFIREWEADCWTIVDCHFSHPPSRPTPYKAGGFKAGPKKASSAYTATFNNPSNPAISAWPTEGTNSKSDRLKRFTQTNEQDGPVERIIPGESTVEVMMDDDDVTTTTVKEETMKDGMEEDKVVAV